MKKVVLFIPFLLFGFKCDVDKIDKIINYHFVLDFSKIKSPFHYEKKIIKSKQFRNKNIVRYDYKLVYILNDKAKIKIIKYVNNYVNDIRYKIVKKSDIINGCKVISINELVKLKCKRKIIKLRVENIKIPFIKELK